MKYYLDTEFLEGSQKKLFGKTKPTIDLISIGLVGEDGREYYAISKDFNLKEAWNRYDIAPQTPFEKYNGYEGKKIYWIRENVLLPIFKELYNKSVDDKEFIKKHFYTYRGGFTYSNLKTLINHFGKSNRHIANEICAFIYGGEDDLSGLSPLQLAQQFEISDKSKEPEFYTYYGAYDWVVFCWLFGKMIDLPKGFPMYSRDLKQMLDEKANVLPKELFRKIECSICTHNVLEYLESTGEAFELRFRLKSLKEKHPDYPKQSNEHNALADAHWNKKLHEFLQSV